MTLPSHANLMRFASYASVGVALIIIISKIVVWFSSDSLSLLSSLIDSLLDIGTSLINLAAIHYALKPADSDHKFGHGKVQDIAAFAQATFIAGSALFIMIEGINRFFTPVAIMQADMAIYVMIFSTILTLFLVTFQHYVIAHTHSSVIKADALHYVTDLVVNIGVIASLWISSRKNWIWLDPLLALIIALYISKGAWAIGYKAFMKLMDTELPDEERDKIKQLILSHPAINGMHDLRTRHSGTTPIIQFHLELEGTLSLEEAHRIAEEVEASILVHFPNAEIIIHEDPATDIVLPLQQEQVKAVPHKKRRI